MTGFAVVLGTRPEIVKLAGIVAGLGESAWVVHTGQHYDSDLSQVFLDSLAFPEPSERLALGSLSRADQIGLGTSELGKIFQARRPDAVIVQGDTNSALAGALAANAVGSPLVHVEAGLRSFDRRMPEEHNRVLIDHISDLLAAPTKVSVDNLANEGISGDGVLMCGNTVIEAVRQLLPGPSQRAEMLREHQLSADGYVLATVHRPENTDDREVLATILDQLRALDLRVVLALHPRTAAAIEAWGLGAKLDGLDVRPPLSGQTFLGLAAEAAVLVSDSGGVQEEATVLGRPLVVVRRSTERPEAFEHHATLVAPSGIANAVRAYLSDLSAVHRDLARRESPFGDGTASATIVGELRTRFGGS